MSDALPRVTQVLAALGLGPDFGAVAPAVLEAALARGTALHALIEAHAYGYLDEREITPGVAPYFSGYLKFLVESGHEPIASEFEVVHPTWRYVGHPDRLGWLTGRRCLLDWKSGEAVDLIAAGYQLAAYRLAWNASHPTEPVDLTAVLQLREDGTYRYHDVNAVDYEQVWLAALVVYHARQERGR